MKSTLYSASRTPHKCVIGKSNCTQGGLMSVTCHTGSSGNQSAILPLLETPAPSCSKVSMVLPLSRALLRASHPWSPGPTSNFSGHGLAPSETLHLPFTLSLSSFPNESAAFSGDCFLQSSFSGPFALVCLNKSSDLQVSKGPRVTKGFPNVDLKLRIYVVLGLPFSKPSGVLPAWHACSFTRV